VSSEALKRPEVEEYVRFYIKQTSTRMIEEVGYVPMTDEAMKANLDKFEKFLVDNK
jgi:phosphate transport system substrate-binding protein